MNKHSPKLQPSKADSQRGSAVIDFVLVAAPLVLTALTVISICLSSFTLMIIRDSAVEGARFAALADQDSDAGCDRARSAARSVVDDFVTLVASCESTETEEIVRLDATFPLFGLIAGSRSLSAIARAPREN